MRWCAGNSICRFLHRHIPALIFALVFIVCANQLLHYSSSWGQGATKSNTPVCYQIVSPFSSGAGPASASLSQSALSSSSTNAQNTEKRHQFQQQFQYLGKLSKEQLKKHLQHQQFQRQLFVNFRQSGGGGGHNNDSVFNATPQIATFYNYVPPEIPWAQARLDNRRMLKIYEWVWPGQLWEDLMDRFDVCLATQGSIDRISSIAEVSEKWLGPISLAVYVAHAEELQVLHLFIAYMRKCSALFNQTVSIHLAVPLHFNPHNFSTSSTTNFDFGPYDDFPCGQPHQFIAYAIKNVMPDGIDKSGLYPQNHMRNIARKTCGTAWVFMTDVDIIPRPNSSFLLQEFYETPEAKCTKCAFVIPVFELEKSVPYPETKKQLIKYANRGLARQFHLKIYRYGHWATNYSLWQSSSVEEDPVKVSHSVGGRMNHYEPFYISSDEIPAHEERFVGYGFTRSSQVLEARISGWKFFVVTPLFAIHWGLQTPQTLRSAPLPIPLQVVKIKQKDFSRGANSRRMQNSRNHVIYTDFVSELVARYNISVSRKKTQRRSAPARIKSPNLGFN